MLTPFARLAMLALLLIPPTVAAQRPPAVTPESVGMSAPRLARLTQVLEEYARTQQVAGTVTLVARSGRVVYHEAAGFRDLEQRSPMRRDTIFRIASQTKALTSVAIMQLVEEGKLLLTDPVSKFLPSFEQTTVRRPAGAAPVNARRRITIRDLLTHTAGVSYGGEAHLADQYKAAGFTAWYFADRPEPIGHWVDKLGTLPFAAHPGERFVYGYSTDILGAVVERISGMSLDRFLSTRITAPLKMTDTHFFLPAAKADRLATVYEGSATTNVTRAPDGHPGQGAYVEGPRAAFSGGAGLLSTAGDYARFLQMLLNRGALGETRLLSPKSVELMTADHIGALYGTPGRGFGLGFEVVTDLGRSGRYGSEGEFSWGGAYFSRYWVDPKEELVVVFLAQLLPAAGNDLQEKVRVLVNQAIVGPAPGELRQKTFRGR
jgi:CubicO group peptidase (beta-lactamase class C family)